jgi:hypothetical protein
MAAWTIVVNIICIEEVYGIIAMPVFNTTLMGLLGLSAGTYRAAKSPNRRFRSSPWARGLRCPEPARPAVAVFAVFADLLTAEAARALLGAGQQLAGARARAAR